MTNRFPIEDFHESADGDDYAPAIMRAQLSVAQYGPMILDISDRQVRCLSRVDIIRPFFQICGGRASNSSVNAVQTNAPMPTLWFPNGGGIETHHPGSYLGGTYGSLVVDADSAARGDDFLLDGVAVCGPGVLSLAGSASPYVGSIDDHGFRPRFTFRLHDVLIRGFRGWGIYGNASSGSTENQGNINGSFAQGVQIRDCGSPAMYIGGGDANVVTTKGPFRVAECGADMKSRGGTFARVLAGQAMYEVTITAAANSTLYRLVVSGNNADYTSDSSATLTEIAAGLAVAVNALALSNVYAQQIDDDRVLVYSTNSASFTCTESSSNMTLASTAATTTPSSVYLVGGPATNDLREGDTCTCWMPTETWTGFVRGDITDAPVGYGYMAVSLRFERTGRDAGSITQVSGTTWQIIKTARSWTGPAHTGKTLEIFGSDTVANNGSFPITAVASGIYGASSVRLRVNYAVDGETYWALIRPPAGGNMVRVSVVASASSTTPSVRTQLVDAINAASITGITAVATSSADLTISGSGVIVAPGARMDNVDGAGRTVIEYTNANAVTDSTFDGYWRIAATTATRGAYAPSGGAIVHGRGCQVMIAPQIETQHDHILIVGPTDGDGFVIKGGRPRFGQCYTEGELPAITTAEGGWFDEGSMYNQIGAKSKLVDSTRHVFTPEVTATYADPAYSGAISGHIGDAVHENSAFGFQSASDAGYDDHWRMMLQDTNQGSNYWELVLNVLSEAVALRLGTLRNARTGPASLGVAQPGLFLNLSDGTVRNPRSLVGNGSDGVTADNEGMTGAIGYVEGPRINGSYNVSFDCVRVFLISSYTAASHASVGIGTHLLPVGSRGRVIIRNVQGMTNAEIAAHLPKAIKIVETSHGKSTFVAFECAQLRLRH